jgi:hypothetical protein
VTRALDNLLALRERELAAALRAFEACTAAEKAQQARLGELDAQLSGLRNRSARTAGEADTIRRISARLERVRRECSAELGRRGVARARAHQAVTRALADRDAARQAHERQAEDSRRLQARREAEAQDDRAARRPDRK